MSDRPVPRATYRLQFRDGMDFDRATRLVPYLRRLGISHLYASPVFTAAPGSTHGYDVADYNEIDPMLGGRAGLDRLSHALRAEGLGLVLDIVPNHMAAHPANPWWHDVLEWGADAAHARHFDIDWSADRLLLPILGVSYAEALEARAFRIVRDGDALAIDAAGLSLPLTPSSWALVLAQAPGRNLDTAARVCVAVAIGDGDAARAVLKACADADVEAAIDAANADRDIIHRLHEMQNWRLAHWRMAREALTYRRFFEISGLVGVRVELDDVFDEVHRLTFELIQGGCVDALRIDHVDGLVDPAGYLARLREHVGAGLPIWVEKILHHGERLPAGWPVAGTTGYEFIADMADLMVDPHGEGALAAAWTGFEDIGATDIAGLKAKAKTTIITHNLASELDALTDIARDLAAHDLARRDLGRDTLRQAIIAMAKALPVYRTYVDLHGPSLADRELVAATAAAAKASRDLEDPVAVDFIAALLTLERDEPADQAAALQFARRFQQVTGPVTAKAVEDTLFYRYNFLVALNEVGGDPARFGASLEMVHAALAARTASPHTMLATATHDTKRGEDARARLYALSLAPERWGAATERWSRALHNRPGGKAVEGGVAWLFFQTLLAVWPAGADPTDAAMLEPLAARVTDFLTKAVREAKLRTSWTSVDAGYEAAVTDFAAGALDPAASDGFLQDFAATTETIISAGQFIALSQTAIKLTAPGLPDIYQGSEVGDYSLVDPDNRRSPDFDALAEQLGAARASEFAVRKQALIAALLRMRREAPTVFAGTYRPVDVSTEDVFAFMREAKDGMGLLVAVPVRQLAGALGGLLCKAPRQMDVRLIMPRGGGPWHLRDLFGEGVVATAADGSITLPSASLPRVLVALPR